MNVFLIVAGLILVGMTIADVFETVVAPGGSQASLRVVRRLVFLLLPVWKGVRGKERGISGLFAPVVMVASFVVWVCLLTLGFAMLAYAARADFSPPPADFWDTIYFAGASIVTIGLSETDATGAARWVVLCAGFCGLAAITLAVTYLLMVQNNVARRDTGILKLNTTAGEPPSALTLLETLATLRNRGELGEILQAARDWCVTVRQSHATHPSVIYFQSIGAGVGWPSAVGALLDLALFVELWLDDEEIYGPAVLLRKAADDMAEELARFAGLKPKPEACSVSVLQEIADKLGRAGYRLKEGIDYQATADTRARLQACVNAMAEHLGKPTAVLLR